MNTPTEVANITFDSIQAHGPTVMTYPTYLKLACMTAFSRSRQTGIQCQMSVDGLVETAPPNDQTAASGGRNE